MSGTGPASYSPTCSISERRRRPLLDRLRLPRRRQLAGGAHVVHRRRDDPGHRRPHRTPRRGRTSSVAPHSPAFDDLAVDCGCPTPCQPTRSPASPEVRRRIRSEPTCSASAKQPLASARRKRGTAPGRRPPGARTRRGSPAPAGEEPTGPAGVVGLRRLRAVPTVDEEHRERGAPVCGDRRAGRRRWGSRRPRGLPPPGSVGGTAASPCGRSQGRPRRGRGAPSRLDLLRPAVVVDGEHDGAGGPPRASAAAPR